MSLSLDEAKRIALDCGFMYSAVSCPLWQVKLLGVIQFSIVIVGFLFVRAIENSGILCGRQRVDKSVQFLCVLTLYVTNYALLSFLPAQLAFVSTNYSHVGLLSDICDILIQYCYLIFADQSTEILSNLRFPFVKLMRVTNWVAYILVDISLFYYCTAFVFDSNFFGDSTFFEFLRIMPFHLNLATRIYATALLSLAFILNESVSRCMPRRFLIIMKSLIFIESLSCLVAILLCPSYYTTTKATPMLAIIETWILMDLVNRVKIGYGLSSMLDVIVYLISLLVLALLMYFMSRVEYVEPDRREEPRTPVHQDLMTEDDV